MSFWPVLAAVVALAVVYVMVPVGFAVFSHYRHPKRVRCPKSGQDATVMIDPRRAGLAAAAGGHWLALRSCSLLRDPVICGAWCARFDHGAFHEVSESSR